MDIQAFGLIDNNNPRAHNLSVEGDVFAYDDATITMEHAAVSNHCWGWPLM